MSTKPGTSKRLTQNERQKALRSAWEAFASETDAYTRLQTEGVFNALRRAVSALITEDAARFGRLGENDERMFAHYARLMDMYREAVALYENEKNDSVTQTVGSILDGVNTVLTSRLKQFEDGAEAEGSNPVSLEKQKIFEKAAAGTVRPFDRQIRQFTDQKLPGENGCLAAGRRAFLQNDAARGARAVRSAVHGMVWESCAGDLYTIYRDGLRAYLASLNDLHQRKTFRYYMELMESEQEVLGSIIKVQAAALEAAVEQPTVSEAEKATVYRVLSLLRESHQYFGRAVTEIQSVIGESEPVAAQPARTDGGRTFEAFEAYLLEVFEEHLKDNLPPPETLDENKSLFLSAIDRETDALFKQITLVFNKAVYRFQRVVSEELLMADEMNESFERIRRCWPDGSALPPEDAHTVILNGILETIGIKIESMQENVYAFNEDGIRTINEFAAGKQEIGYDDRLKAYNQVLDRWTSEMAGFGVVNGVKTTDFFTRCLDMDVLAEHKKYYVKRETDYAAKIDKALLAFKRETLLYEVSTYEEILIYSVSRLRESMREPVIQTVALLDETMAALEVLLKKNNIQVIRPAPHDMFNGREHEVLMAEKQDGFNKGEIIKPINSGFKQKDTVILRANVIAAK